jgi:two-component system, OmpR family, phosphate regulon sensor histidine kinase PhoR
MVYLLSILLCAALFAFWRHVSKTRRMVADLEDAVRAKRRLLMHESSGSIKRVGLERLVYETNNLIDGYRYYAEAESGYSNQVESTLGAIQEAVIIFDERRIIEFANESAQRVLNGGRILRGARLESVLRSSGLLEFLNVSQENTNLPPKQVSLECRGELMWFEASCARITSVSAPQSVSTLLVLHDITRLKGLEVMRRDFVANVSHELRTPLTIIKGFAETLVEDNATLPVEARARFLDKIVNNAERLHVLVEDLLTLSRLESKPEQINLTVQSFQKLLEETAENYRSRLNSDTQEIVLEVDKRVGDFAFDRFRVNQVVDNLVENAFRYAPEFTRLTLRAQCSQDGSLVTCSVIDDGPGIPAKDLPHIFERFYRVDKGRSRERGGTGLGLSIMKHIVQLHGGDVSVESEQGQGVTIHFSLPYVQLREE